MGLSESHGKPNPFVSCFLCDRAWRLPRQTAPPYPILFGSSRSHIPLVSVPPTRLPPPPTLSRNLQYAIKNPGTLRIWTPQIPPQGSAPPQAGILPARAGTSRQVPPVQRVARRLLAGAECIAARARSARSRPETPGKGEGWSKRVSGPRDVTRGLRRARPATPREHDSRKSGKSEIRVVRPLCR